MVEANRYSPPQTAIEPQRRKPFTVAPIAAGLIAIIAAGFVLGAGVIPVTLGVVCWWVYKFWPRRPEPMDLGTEQFLRTLEEPATATAATREQDAANDADACQEVFKQLKV
jgi:hypothetical protein